MTDDERAALRRFNPARYAAAQQRVKDAPLTLTDEDFDQLSSVAPHLEDAAREAQREAQLALVRAHMAPAPLVTKTAEPLVTNAEPPALKDFVNKDGSRTVSYKALDMVVDMMIDLMKTHVDRLKALEAQNATLSDRILELEAAHAIKSPPWRAVRP